MTLEQQRAACVFDEAMEDVATRLDKEVRKAVVVTAKSRQHVTLQRLIAKEGERREKASSFPCLTWDRPKFDSAADQRRIRLLNSLCFALGREGCRTSLCGSDSLDHLDVVVGDTTVALKVPRIEFRPAHQLRRNR